MTHLTAKAAALVVAAAAAVGALAGCGDSGGTGGGGGDFGAGGAGGGDDGKLHPEGNGVAIDEGTACERLYDALLATSNGIGCVSTFRACDGLLQELSGTTCAEYDEQSVGGCVDHYQAAADCDDLKARADECVPAILSDEGCPE